MRVERIVGSWARGLVLVAGAFESVSWAGPETECEITSTPAGARVFIDGEAVAIGTTPTRVALERTKHTIKLAADGFQTQDLLVTVSAKPRAPCAFAVTLEPVLDAKPEVAPVADLAPQPRSEQRPDGVYISTDGGVTWARTVQMAPVIAPKPVAKAEVTMFGRVQLLVGVDPQNLGDVPDFTALPAGRKDWNSSFQLNGHLGGRFLMPRKLGGFAIKGTFTTALYIRRIFYVPTAVIDFENAKAGVVIRVGKMFAPIVNSLPPGAFQYPNSFGNLVYAITGANVAKTLGPVVVQIGAGRPDFPVFTSEITPLANANPALPQVEARIAYINRRRVGQLPPWAAGEPTPAPLTVSVSGGAGQQRVGPGEKAAVLAASPGAVDPRTEDLWSWIVSAEIVIPFAGLVLAGEAFTGEGINNYFGGIRQRPRVDVMTGEHRSLRASGGWAQLSYTRAERDWTVLALAGIDRIDSGLDYGVGVEGGPAIKQNRLILGSVSRTFDGLRVGLQFQQLKTTYQGLPNGSVLGVLADCSINF